MKNSEVGCWVDVFFLEAFDFSILWIICIHSEYFLSHSQENEKIGRPVFDTKEKMASNSTVFSPSFRDETVCVCGTSIFIRVTINKITTEHSKGFCGDWYVVFMPADCEMAGNVACAGKSCHVSPTSCAHTENIWKYISVYRCIISILLQQHPLADHAVCRRDERP